MEVHLFNATIKRGPSLSPLPMGERARVRAKKISSSPVKIRQTENDQEERIKSQEEPG
jgi:hypothetical protein